MKILLFITNFLILQVNAIGNRFIQIDQLSRNSWTDQKIALSNFTQSNIECSSLCSTIVDCNAFIHYGQSKICELAKIENLDTNPTDRIVSTDSTKINRPEHNIHTINTEK